jgi:hypothetical protein
MHYPVYTEDPNALAVYERFERREHDLRSVDDFDLHWDDDDSGYDRNRDLNSIGNFGYKAE